VVPIGSSDCLEKLRADIKLVREVKRRKAEGKTEEKEYMATSFPIGNSTRDT